MSIDTWQIYLLVGILLAIAEILVSGFVLLPIGVAFAVTAPLTALTDSTILQLSALAINNVIFLYFFRAFFLKRPQKNQVSTAAERMIGERALVTEAITANGEKGYVKLYGDHWRAVSEEQMDIPEGSHVIIKALDGNKVIVKAEDLSSRRQL